MRSRQVRGGAALGQGGPQARRHRAKHGRCAHIRTCVGYLDTFKAADFTGAESRLIELPYFEGKVIAGSDYLMEMALPNFFFHVTTAYSILRHSGVPLGKRDFIGSANLRDK